MMFLGLFPLWILVVETPKAAVEPLAVELCRLLSNTVFGMDADDLETRVSYRLEEDEVFLTISEIYYGAGTKISHMIERKTVPVSQISRVSERTARHGGDEERFYILISFSTTGGAYQYSSEKTDAFARNRTIQLGLFSREQSAEILRLFDRLAGLLRPRP